MENSEVQIWECRLAAAGEDGRIACDFAELIWNDQICDVQQVKLLSSPIARVREVTAWAVKDLGRDGIAMRTLLENGPNDTSDRVRLMMVSALKEASFLTILELEKHAAALAKDPNSRVQAMLAEVRAR